MSEQVQLKINAINQLKLLRMSTFKDKLCFLDEDIQNAQRAKATEFRVTVDSWDNSITIENNGEILEDPQVLFSIAESGWKEDVKKTENPFGTGFFSNITVSNYIEIFSGYKHIIFDVDKMINEQNINVFTEEIEEEYKGFKLILHNFDSEEIYSWYIEERVKMLGQYVHELDVYYNDKLIEKKDLTEGDDSYFQIKLEEKDFQGWLGLYGGWGLGNKLNIFYKGRLVTKLDDFSYVKGDIHINDKTLNLTSPDRKDIIRDTKFKEFKEIIKLYVEDLCNEALLNGDETEVEKYSNAISYYADKNKVKSLVKFATFKSNDNDDLEYLKGISSAKIKNPSINNMKEYCLYLEKEARQLNNEDKNEINKIIEIKNQPIEAKGVIEHEGYWSNGNDGDYHEAYVEKPEIDEEELVEKRGSLLTVSGEPTFWMSFEDIVKYEYKLNVAKHYNIRIIIARNKVEKELLTLMKETDNVLHISELKEEIEVKATLSNIELSLEEQRALMILNMISTQILEQEKNLFAIGDLMVSKIVKVEIIDEESEIVEDKVTVVADKENKQILIDRTVLNKNHLSNNLNEELELKDYKFILSNLKNISKEIHLLGITSEDKAVNSIIEALGGAI